jgi:DNA-binding HxlR family transcriptional regulator
MEWVSADLEHCPLIRSLAVLGKRWTLVILREVFNNVRRFEDLQQHLGVSPSVLSRRLAEMVDDGLLERTPYREDGARGRQEYHPSQSAWALFPVLIALMQWGDRYVNDGKPQMSMVHKTSGLPVVVDLVPQGSPAYSPAEVELLWAGQPVDQPLD